jgi:hypothetical protein
MRRLAHGAPPSPTQELRGGPGVDDVGLHDPSAPRRGHAELDRGEVVEHVRVGADGDVNAQLPGAPGVGVVQVEPRRIRVDLDGLAVSFRGLEDLLQVDGIRRALADQPAGRVREDAHARMREGAADPRRHLALGLLEGGMHGPDHEVELAQHGGGVVQRAVGEDVALAPGEDRDPGVLRLERADLAHVLAQLLDREAAGHTGRTAVVGDEDIVVAAGPRRVDERVEARPAVGGARVAVEIAPDVLERHEVGQAARQRDLDLTQILPELRRDVRQPDGRVHLPFRRPRDAPSGRHPEDAILRDLQAALERHLADADVVLLRSGEVGERRAEASRLHHPQVHLDALAVPDRRRRPEETGRSRP